MIIETILLTCAAPTHGVIAARKFTKLNFDRTDVWTRIVRLLSAQNLTMKFGRWIFFPPTPKTVLCRSKQTGLTNAPGDYSKNLFQVPSFRFQVVKCKIKKLI
ncbi:MAG: hypothetical protein M3388_16520 [Acidobacteriota bacterium]|nr:hypothetical protein [Acidobacteriota bacterium]